MTTSMTGYSSGMGAKTPRGYERYSMPLGDQGWQSMIEQMRGAFGPGVTESADYLRKMLGGDESFFQQLEAPAYRQFEQGMGQLGSRFAGMGMGGLKSSGFKQAGAGMATDLAMGLQQQRMGLRQQALQDLLGMSGQLMRTPTQGYGLARKPPSFWESMMPALGMGLGGFGSQAGLMGLGKWMGIFGQPQIPQQGEI